MLSYQAVNNDKSTGIYKIKLSFAALLNWLLCLSADWLYFVPRMCILFIFNGNGQDSDYKFILASNRDEYYDRPASSAAPWLEDPLVVGGKLAFLIILIFSSFVMASSVHLHKL